MNVRTEKIASGEDEVIVRYKEKTREVNDILTFLHGHSNQILVKTEKDQYILLHKDIYYFESVNNTVFAYTKENAYQTDYTLNELEEECGPSGFFRCSKSFLINITKIASVNGMLGNRIDATLTNKEHVIISRHYVKEFKERLMGGKNNG